MMAARPGVLIAGAGVAGLEALLALRAVMGDHVDITIVSPETKFVNSSMALNEPSKPQRRHGLALQDIASDLAARWHRGSVQSVDAERRKVVTAADVMPHDEPSVPTETRLDSEAAAEARAFAELRDLPAR